MTGADPPWEYVKFVLCRDVYHCTETVLNQENAVTIFRHLIMISGEGLVDKIKNTARLPNA